MRIRIKQGLTTLRRTHEFLRHREYHVPMGDLAPHIAQLGAVVERLSVLSADQEASTRRLLELTARRRALARSLRWEFLRPLAQVGKTLLRDEATHPKHYPMYRKKDDEGLLQAAQASAERLQQDIARFAERGIAPEFAERLREATVAFKAARTERALEVARRAAATKGMEQAMSLGYASMRILNTLLRPTLERSPELLAEWDTVRRYRRRVERGAVAGGAPEDVVGDASREVADDVAGEIGGEVLVEGETVGEEVVVRELAA
jgi:hypothetical protein